MRWILLEAPSGKHHYNYHSRILVLSGSGSDRPIDGGTGIYTWVAKSYAYPKAQCLSKEYL